MIRTHEENLRWWNQLSSLKKIDIFDYLAEKAPNAEGFLFSLKKHFKLRGELSEKQLSALRNFYENSDRK